MMGKVKSFVAHDLMLEFTIISKSKKENLVSLFRPSMLAVAWTVRLLRVLDLQGCRYVKNHHLVVSGEFHHLKYTTLKHINVC